jgi:hypothetical protein
VVASVRRDRDVSQTVSELSKEVAEQGLVIRALVASLIALAAIVVLAVPLATRVITSGWPLIGDICGGAALMAGAFACLFGKKRACRLVTAIGVVVGIVVAVQSFVT